MNRTSELQAELATDSSVTNANTVVAVPPSTTSPAPFLMLVYVSGQPILRAFDPTLTLP